MPLVAVARDKFACAIPGPRAKPVYEQLELVDALNRVYASDAHLVSYIDAARTDGWQHRWSKSAPDHSSLFTTSIVVDVDNPGHSPWSDAERARAVASYQRSALPFGVYHTSNGARFLFELAERVPVTAAEPLIRRALSLLDSEGFGVDYGAKDWTRHMRLPNVLRNGRPFATPYMDLSRMRPVVLEPLDIPTRQRATRTKRPDLPPIPFTPSLAEHWQARARTIGAAVAATVTADFHAMYLAIAGALLQRQVPPEHVPELVRLVALAAASSKPQHHEKSARDTVTRHLSGQTITGMRDLSTRYPVVADAVHDALADARDIHLRSQTSIVTPPPSPLSVTVAALERTIANAPDGLTVIVAECGLGKTAASIRVAAERATSKPASKRAPAQTKTAIACDKNELAIQIASDLAATGVAVRRVFGPLSVLKSDGTPVCKLHATALPLVEGGQSVTWEFCLGRGKYKCPHYDECPAKDGEQLYASSDPSVTPRVTVGTHALLHELDASAGSTGTLIIDEPPPLLETFVVLSEDIALAVNNISSFQRDFAEAMAPVLTAVRDWDDPEIAWEDLTDTLERPPTVDANNRAITRPPLRFDTARACRADISLARIVGKASSVIRALFRAMTDPDATVRLEDEPRRIVVTAPRPDLAAALRREGAVVAMDANADLHLPGFAKVIGYDPPVHRFVAEDGARIERTLLRAGSATRRSWLSHGRLVLDTGLLAAMRGIVAWVDECAATVGRPVTLGIITIRLVEIALRYAEGEDVVADWVKARQSSSTLLEARDAIAALFATPNLARPLQFAHYGATRGLNRLAGVDCLATVGDPWPNLGTVQAEATYLAVDWDARAEATAQAELEQAHGRLRTVHRTQPGFALHVGRVVPGGSGWRALPIDSTSSRPAVRATSLQGGRPPAGAPMPPAELAGILAALGGVRAAARAVGCSPSTVSRYQAGQGVPPGVASRLRQLAQEVPNGTAAE
jgi:hypothetical protein